MPLVDGGVHALAGAGVGLHAVGGGEEEQAEPVAVHGASVGRADGDEPVGAGLGGDVADGGGEGVGVGPAGGGVAVGEEGHAGERRHGDGVGRAVGGGLPRPVVGLGALEVLQAPLDRLNGGGGHVLGQERGVGRLRQWKTPRRQSGRRQLHQLEAVSPPPSRREGRPSEAWPERVSGAETKPSQLALSPTGRLRGPPPPVGEGW